MYQKVGQHFNSQNLKSVAKGHTVSHFSAYLDDADRNPDQHTIGESSKKLENYYARGIDEEIAHLPEE